MTTSSSKSPKLAELDIPAHYPNIPFMASFWIGSGLGRTNRWEWANHMNLRSKLLMTLRFGLHFLPSTPSYMIDVNRENCKQNTCTILKE